MAPEGKTFFRKRPLPRAGLVTTVLYISGVLLHSVKKIAKNYQSENIKQLDCAKVDKKILNYTILCFRHS